MAASKKTYGLPKWPALVVHGDPVTPDQAAEIIVRTDSAIAYPSCNDREWVKVIADIVGHTLNEYGMVSWDREENSAVENALGLIRLGYLSNSRIASAYIGGPHGWCAWDGTIGCRTYNVGKWPSAEDVLDDWTKVAAAFPYLNLIAQLWSGEQCEDGTLPVVEYLVREGTVEMRDPQAAIGEPSDDFDPISLARSLMVPGGERGCSEERLRSAVEMVRAKMRKAVSRG